MRRHPHAGPGDWLRKKRGLTRLRPHCDEGRVSHFRLETGRAYLGYCAELIDRVEPKFSSWSNTEFWQVVDIEPMPVFGKFYNG